MKKTLGQALMWSAATERRFIWTFGVVFFGGSMWVWTTLDPHPSGPAFSPLASLGIWVVMGYVWGWVMWQARRWFHRH